MDEVRLKCTLRLMTGEGVRGFGPGVATLLEAVDRCASLRAAAGEMQRAYSKAWRIVRTAEGIFGLRLLDSTTGGKGGGGARLTPEARKLLAAYRALEKEVCAFADERFSHYFREYLRKD